MWLKFYGLNKQPFGVTPDPSFLFMGPAHQEAFASMVYGIETGRGFMALVAAPGMGKTTLLLKLMEKLRDTAVTAYLFQVHTNSKEFLKNLLLDLDVQPVGQDMSDLQKQVREVLIQSSNAGKRLVLVIDEAQNLDDSVLEMVRMLSNFETPQAKLLQTILVGQPALADKLARPHLAQLRQRISIIAHFSPLRSDEICKYIEHRLRVAGYKGGRMFTPDAMEMIVRYSGGIPRIINNLCFNAMSLSYAKGRRKIDESTLREVISDLSLESLGDLRVNGRRGVSPRGATRASAGKGKASARPRPANGHQSWGMGGESWDDADTSRGAPGWVGETSWRPSYTPDDRPGSGHRSGLQGVLLFLLATAAVCAWTWRSEWLRPSADFIVQSVESVLDNSDKQENLAINKQSKDGQFVRESSEKRPEGGNQPSDAADQPAGEISGQLHGVENAPTAAPGITPDAASTDEEPKVVSPGSEKNNNDSDNPKMKRPEIKSSRNRGPGDDLGAIGATGQLVVQSSSSGAQIRINGRENPKWVTPHLFSLVPGTYMVSVIRGGHISWARRVYVERGEKNWVMAELKDDEGKGIFIVDTEPTGMQVFIDGKPYGASRVAATLSPGWHDYEVQPGQGIKPVFGHFHLNSGEALTKKFRVSLPESSGASSPPIPPIGNGRGRSESRRFTEASLE